MTAGEPASGFRERVLERAAVEAAEPRAHWRAPVWLAVAGAAVVVGFAGLIVFRGLQRTVEPPAVITAAGATAAVAGPGLEPDALDAARGLAEARAPRVEAPSVSVLEWRSRAIPELAAVAPLAFDEIQPVWLSITQLDVTPLGILPITFAPIAGDGGRR